MPTVYSSEQTEDAALIESRQRRVFAGGASIRALFQRDRLQHSSAGKTSASPSMASRPLPRPILSGPSVIPPVPPPTSTNPNRPQPREKVLSFSSDNELGGGKRDVALPPAPPKSAPATTQRRGEGAPSGLHLSLSSPLNYGHLAKQEQLDQKLMATALEAEEYDTSRRQRAQLPVYSPQTMPSIIPLHAFVDVYTRTNKDATEVAKTNSGASTNPNPNNARRGDPPLGTTASSPSATLRALGATHESILRKSPYELTLRDLDNVEVMSDGSLDGTDLDFAEGLECDNPLSQSEGGLNNSVLEESMRRYISYKRSIDAATRDAAEETELDREMKLFERLASDEAFEAWLGLGTVRTFGTVLEEVEERRARAVHVEDREVDAKLTKVEKAWRKHQRRLRRQEAVLGKEQDDPLSRYYASLRKTLTQPSPNRGGGQPSGGVHLSMSQRFLFSLAGVIQSDNDDGTETESSLSDDPESAGVLLTKRGSAALQVGAGPLSFEGTLSSSIESPNRRHSVTNENTPRTISTSSRHISHPTQSTVGMANSRRLTEVRKVIEQMGFSVEDQPIPMTESPSDRRRRLRQLHPRRSKCLQPTATHAAFHQDPCRAFSNTDVRDFASGVFSFRVPGSFSEIHGGVDVLSPLAPSEVIPGYVADDDPSADVGSVGTMYPPPQLPLLTEFRKWKVFESSTSSSPPLPLEASLPGKDNRTIAATGVLTIPFAHPPTGEMPPPLSTFAPPQVADGQLPVNQQLETSSTLLLTPTRKLSDQIRFGLLPHINRSMEYLNGFCAPLSFEAFLRDAQACVDGIDADGYDPAMDGTLNETDRLRLHATDTSDPSTHQASVWVQGPVRQFVPYSDRHNPGAESQRARLEAKARKLKMEPADLALNTYMETYNERRNGAVGRHTSGASTQENTSTADKSFSDADDRPTGDTVNTLCQEMRAHVLPLSSGTQPGGERQLPKITLETACPPSVEASPTLAPTLRPPLLMSPSDAVAHYDLDNREAVEGGGWLVGTPAIVDHMKHHQLLTAHALVSVCGEVSRFLDCLMVFANSQHAQDAEDAEVRDSLLGGCFQLRELLVEFNDTVAKMETRVLEFENFEGVRDTVSKLVESKIGPIERVLEWMVGGVPFPHQRAAVEEASRVSQLEEILSRGNDESPAMKGPSALGSRRELPPSDPHSSPIPDDVTRLLQGMFKKESYSNGEADEPVTPLLEGSSPRERTHIEIYALTEGILKTLPAKESAREQHPTQTVSEYIANTIGTLTNLLTEMAATSSPLLGLHRTWKETLLDTTYKRLAYICHLHATLQHGYVDPILLRRLYDTDPNAQSNASNKFVQRAIARRRRPSLEQFMYERGEENLELLLERFAAGNTWLVRHEQEKADQLHEDAGADPTSTPRESTVSGGVSAFGEGGSSRPTGAASALSRRQPSRLDDTTATNVQPNVALNSITVAQFVRRLMCEYRCTPQQVATKVKNSPSVTTGIQLCLASRFLLHELGGEFDELWGFSWLSAPTDVINSHHINVVV